MSEKLKTVQKTCNVTGIPLAVLYLFMVIFRPSIGLLVARIIISTSVIAIYAVELGALMISNKKCGGSILIITIFFCNLIVTVLWLI